MYFFPFLMHSQTKLPYALGILFIHSASDDTASPVLSHGLTTYLNSERTVILLSLPKAGISVSSGKIGPDSRSLPSDPLLYRINFHLPPDCLFGFRQHFEYRKSNPCHSFETQGRCTGCTVACHT